MINPKEFHSDQTRHEIAALIEIIPAAPQPHVQTDRIIAQATAPQRIIPGGSVARDSGLYIQRTADQEVFEAIQRERALITIRGPRQIGKTSLMMSIYRQMCEHATMRVAYLDFQTLTDEELQSSATIWLSILKTIAEQLHLSDWSAADWNEHAPYTSNVFRFLEAIAGDPAAPPLLLCFDEVDRLFTSPLKSQFFKSLRAFYNSGAIKPFMKSVRWLLGTSSEPSFFIDNLTESPFNIGLRIELQPFTREEVAEFARRHGLSLTETTLNTLLDYVGGHPYLAHLVLYHLAEHPDAQTDLFITAKTSHTLFKDHLQRFLLQFQQDRDMADAMRDLLNGLSCDNLKTVNRLEAAGLVRWDGGQKVVPACRLYAEYFSQTLGVPPAESQISISIYPAP